MKTASLWQRPLLLAGGVFLKFTSHEMVLVDVALRSRVLTALNWSVVCTGCSALYYERVVPFSFF